jgi:hypothetical protein
MRAAPAGAACGEEVAMRWVIPTRPKTDRLACAWLIRRFIDPAGELVFTLPQAVLGVAKAQGAWSVDVPEADFAHQGGRCAFEVLLERYGLGGDPGLGRLARAVHAAYLADDVTVDPLAPVVLAAGQGGLAVAADDDHLVARASFIYDALYA